MELVPLSPRLGVEVRGIDVGLPLPDDDVGRLQTAFDERKLVCVRSGAIDLDGHRRFVRSLGFSVAELDGSVERSVSNRRSGGDDALAFHPDHIYTAGGSSPGLSLYALEVPSGGTSTSFADTVLAYETLPDDLRERVAGLQAWHAFGLPGDRPLRRNPAFVPYPGFRSLHPVIGTHPRTGTRFIAVSDIHTQQIDGMALEDSADLLDLVCAHIAKPEHVYEHHWQLDDLVVWDNVALQHARGANDLSEGPRTLRRLVLDDRPLTELTPEKILRRSA